MIKSASSNTIKETFHIMASKTSQNSSKEDQNKFKLPIAGMFVSMAKFIDQVFEGNNLKFELRVVSIGSNFLRNRDSHSLLLQGHVATLHEKLFEFRVNATQNGWHFVVK